MSTRVATTSPNIKIMREIPDLHYDDNDDSTYHPDKDEDDDDDDSDNNEPIEPPIDNINPSDPVTNGAVNDDTETHNDPPVPDDVESQGGVVSSNTDSNMMAPSNDQPDEEVDAENNNEALEQAPEIFLINPWSPVFCMSYDVWPSMERSLLFFPAILVPMALH